MKPAIHTHDYKEHVLRIVRKFAGIQPCDQSWIEFEAFISQLVSEGFQRGGLYRLILEVATEYRGSLAEESMDALDNYLDGLVGWCHLSYCPRFPGEPTDDHEFGEYVHARKWLDQ